MRRKDVRGGKTGDNPHLYIPTTGKMISSCVHRTRSCTIVASLDKQHQVAGSGPPCSWSHLIPLTQSRRPARGVSYRRQTTSWDQASHRPQNAHWFESRLARRAHRVVSDEAQARCLRWDEQGILGLGELPSAFWWHVGDQTGVAASRFHGLPAALTTDSLAASLSGTAQHFPPRA